MFNKPPVVSGCEVTLSKDGIKLHPPPNTMSVNEGHIQWRGTRQSFKHLAVYQSTHVWFWTGMVGNCNLTVDGYHANHSDDKIKFRIKERNCRKDIKNTTLRAVFLWCTLFICIPLCSLSGTSLLGGCPALNTRCGPAISIQVQQTLNNQWLSPRTLDLLFALLIFYKYKEYKAE